MRDRRVLLIAREGMDWQVAEPLAVAGLLPVLSSQLDRGTRCSLAGIAPQLAAMHATSMATGCWPHEHGIVSQAPCDPVTGLPPDFASGERQLPAFWNILSASGLRHHVIGWPASHPAEAIAGVNVSERWMKVPQQTGAEWPLPDGAVQPARLAGRLAGCRARMEEIDLRLLGLFFPRAAEMDLARDPLVLRLVHHLARLYTSHNTVMALLEDEQEACQPWRAFAVFDSFLESVGQDFFKFRGAAAGASAREQRWYGAVVDGAYRVHDALLGEMMAMAGEDVTLMLVADRGFKLRQPAGSAQTLIGGPAHPPGMVVVAGPEILSTGSLHPASVLDVTPTLLHLLGLPIGRDMAGRPWIELETTPRPSGKIDSWSPQCPGFAVAKAAPADPAAECLGTEGVREHHLNLGLCLMAAGRPARAVGHLYHAMAARPENPLAGYHLALALINCGLKQEGMHALAPLFDLGEDDLHLRQHLLSLAIQCADGATALRLLEHPGNIDPGSGELRPAFTLLRGLLALHQGDPGLAESCCRSALKNDPARPEAWLGLSRCLLARGEFREAETTARHALGIAGKDPLVCLILAQCAAQRSDCPAAATFAAEALRLEPDLEQPRHILRQFFPDISPALRDQVTDLLQQARKSSPLHGNHRAEARAGLERARKSIAAARAALRHDAPGRATPASLRHPDKTRDLTAPVIRPPWPDEAMRTLVFLETRTSLEGSLLPLVAVCGEPERLVAAICLAHGNSKVGNLHLQIRPRFLAGPLLPDLLQRVESLARNLNLHLLSLQWPSTSPVCPQLVAAGFNARRTDTWWTATRDPTMDLRFARARHTLAKSAHKYPGMTISPLQTADLPEVNAIVKAHHLTDLQAAETGEMAAEMAMSHDPLLSTVVRLDGTIAAVQLVRRLGPDSVFVHARAVHPAFLAQSGRLNLGFFTRFLDPEYLPIQRWIFSARPEVEKETKAMAARFGALPTASFTLFGKPLL